MLAPPGGQCLVASPGNAGHLQRSRRPRRRDRRSGFFEEKGMWTVVDSRPTASCDGWRGAVSPEVGPLCVGYRGSHRAAGHRPCCQGVPLRRSPCWSDPPRFLRSSWRVALVQAPAQRIPGRRRFANRSQSRTLPHVDLTDTNKKGTKKKKEKKKRKEKREKRKKKKKKRGRQDSHRVLRSLATLADWLDGRPILYDLRYPRRRALSRRPPGNRHAWNVHRRGATSYQ